MSAPLIRTILSLCDYSGAWSQPYRDGGCKVIQIDLKHGGDVRLLKLPAEPIHGVLMAPPCTMFASSGARWERTEAQMIEALSIVDACARFALLCRPAWWALENPIGKLRQYYGPPVMYFNPCDYAGHADDPDAEAYTKRTALWGCFNSAMPAAYRAPVLGSKMHLLPPSENRQELRSTTPQGFARAFMAANP